MKHGVYSGMGLLPGENPREFERFVADIIAEYGPSGRSEEEIVTELAYVMWRKHNISTYRLAERAKTAKTAIYAESQPRPISFLDLPYEEDPRSPEELRALRQKADQRAQVELGGALELLDLGDVVTFDYLEAELALL